MVLRNSSGSLIFGVNQLNRASMLKIVLAFFQSLLAFLAVCLVGLIFYSELPLPFNIVVAIILFLVGAYVGLRVFKIISRRGYTSAASGDNASFELDSLKSTPGHGVSEVEPLELCNAFEDGKINLGKVTKSIWGDWDGRYLDKKDKIVSIKWDSLSQKLAVVFEDNKLLSVYHPRLIRYSRSYLKIIKAKEIVWEVVGLEGEHCEYRYTFSDNGIETSTNTHWKPKSDDMGIGMNAIYLQG